MDANSPYYGFLADNPEISYQYFRPQTGGYNFTNYWRNNSDRVVQDYYSDFVKRLMSGQQVMGMPEYMQQYNFAQNWQNMSPGARGEYATAFRPQVKWNLPYR